MNDKAMTTSFGMEFIRIGTGTGTGKPTSGPAKTALFLSRSPIRWKDWDRAVKRIPAPKRENPDEFARFPIGSYQVDQFFQEINPDEKRLDITYRIPTLAEFLFPFIGFDGETGVEGFRESASYKAIRTWCGDIDNGEAWSFTWPTVADRAWKRLSEMEQPTTAPASIPRLRIDGFEVLTGKMWEAASEEVSMFRNITDGYETSEGLFLCNGDAATPAPVFEKGFPIVRSMYQSEIESFGFRLCAEVLQKV